MMGTAILAHARGLPKPMRGLSGKQTAFAGEFEAAAMKAYNFGPH